MPYEISIDGDVAKVGLSRLPQKNKEIYEAEINQGTSKKAKIIVEKRERDFLVVSIDNKVYQVKQLRRSSGEILFLLNGEEIKATLPSKNRQGEQVSALEKSDVATVNETVTSNFPAKVVSVPTGKGSHLGEGDTIMVLEAMKMEARIKAPKQCTIVEIFVREGDMVSHGTKLAQLKFS
jgi:biotin carboxyl carrier protein